ncbi:MAG: Flp pilus assembly protein CpaB [Caulobacteraceae bacterium]|nr:Flp pilus assembly protein CpaB [Caulobacteraceae bacterium]
MRLATVVSLAASAVLGIGALVVARVWIPATTAKPALSTPAAAAPPVGVPVVVASGALKYGDKLDAGKLTLVRMPASVAPEGAFSSVDEVLKQDGGAPVVLVAMTAREPVLPAKLSGAGARPTVAAEISDNHRAYTIKVSDVAGGGGHIFPGDRVDVLLSRDLSETDPSGEGGKRFVADVVLQDVRVLGMNLNADQDSTDPTVPSTATLEVTMPEAQKLAVAGDLGTLSLALRRTGAAGVQPARAVFVGDVSPVSRARSKPAGGGDAPASREATIVVVHGEESASVHVPREGAGA